MLISLLKTYPSIVASSGKKQSVKYTEETAQPNLEILLKNLTPDLACEMKNFWIDPGTFQLEHLLGKGEIVSAPKELNFNEFKNVLILKKNTQIFQMSLLQSGQPKLQTCQFITLAVAVKKIKGM